MEQPLHGVKVRYTIWKIFRNIWYADGRPHTKKLANDCIRFAGGRAHVSFVARLFDGRPNLGISLPGRYGVPLLLCRSGDNACFRLSGGGWVQHEFKHVFSN